MTQFTPAIQTLQTLLWPVQSVVNFFSPPVPSTASAITVNRQNCPGQITHRAPQVNHAVRTRRSSDGRIVMSGRMSDVCAELDRLCTQAA